jgi:threonine dehydrogenase-like Zn-dependent dehydrogenase
MKAIQLDQPRQFSLLDLPVPAAPAAGEALVRVHRVGICGTDYGGYLGKMPFYSYPRIPGHELGVEVLAVGPDVTNRAARRPLRGRAVHQLPDLLQLPPRPHQLLRSTTRRWA